MNRSRQLSRSRLASLALLGALTLGSACTRNEPAPQADKKSAEASQQPKSDKPVEAPAVPTGPVANPTDSPAVAEIGEVVATVQLPSGTNMSDLAAVIDSIQPGASMMLKMQLPAAIEKAAGFDIAKVAKLDAPLSLVLLDPSSHPQPLALLVEAKDAAGLSEAAKGAGHEVEQRGDLVLIGPAGVVDAAKDFAFTNLSKYPDHTEIIVYPKQLLTSYAGKIDEWLDTMGATMAGLGPSGESTVTMLRSYIKGLAAIGEQTQRVVFSVSASPGNTVLITRFYPVEGSTFASFVEAQVPADHALLSKLPSGTGTTLMSGDLRAGPARAALVDFSVEVIAPMYRGMPIEDWKKVMTPWLDSLDGRYAMTMSMSLDPSSKAMNMQMSALMGVNDSATLWTSWREMLTKMASFPGFEMMGMKVSARHETKVIEHDGVEVDLYATSIDTSALPAAQAAAIEAAGTANQAMHLAAFDDFAVMATAGTDGQAIRSLIDAARGKGDALELSPTLTSVLEDSKQRGDSMLIYFDVAELLANSGAPTKIPFKALSWSIGKHDKALSVRMSLLK